MFGLLEVNASEPREFGPEDTEFLRTYATILGPVIDRLFKGQELRENEAPLVADLGGCGRLDEGHAKLPSRRCSTATPL